MAEVTTEQRGDVSIARAVGEVDMATAQDFASALTDAVSGSVTRLVVDLSGMTFMDSSGVGALFRLGGKLAERRQELRLVVPRGAPIEKMLRLVEIGRIAPLHESLEDAVQA